MRSEDVQAPVTFAASVAASLGAAAAARADEVADAVLDTAAVTEAVQAAEAAVEQVVQASKDAPSNPALMEAVGEAAEALREAEAAVAAVAADATSTSSSLAEAVLDVEEAAEFIKEASAAAKSGGADVSVIDAVQAATTAIQEAAVTALEASGVDAAAVAGATSAAAGAAAGAAQSAFTFLTTTDPATLSYDALAAVAVVYLAPPLAKLGLDAARGYAGDVPPTTALDALVSEGNNALIDIRAAADKEAEGVPDLPDNTKLVELEFVSLPGADAELRNKQSVEAESTAVQIAALKKLSTGMTVYILDDEGSNAKAVAKELNKRGYSKAFVIAGGCQAWIRSKLSMRTWGAPTALLPSDAESKLEIMA